MPPPPLAGRDVLRAGATILALETKPHVENDRDIPTAPPGSRQRNKPLFCYVAEYLAWGFFFLHQLNLCPI